MDKKVKERKRIHRLSFTRALADSCQLFSSQHELKTRKAKGSHRENELPCGGLLGRSPVFLAACCSDPRALGHPGRDSRPCRVLLPDHPGSTPFSGLREPALLSGRLKIPFLHSLSYSRTSPPLTDMPASQPKLRSKINRENKMDWHPQEPATSRQCCCGVRQPEP